jgi:microcystin-dependent protein
MAEAFIGEIRSVGFDYAPYGWLPCDGRTVNISEYDTLFALIGTIYGGDGVNNFKLPDLRGRIPVCSGMNAESSIVYTMGQSLGTEKVALTAAQIPSHVHALGANVSIKLKCSKAAASATTPVGNSLAPNVSTDLMAKYNKTTPDGAMKAGSVVLSGITGASSSGGDVPHDNMQPFQVINYIICTEGIFPSQG